MNFISDYLVSILTVGFLAFLCESIQPCKADGNTVKGAVSFLTSICILITVISPFITTIYKFELPEISYKDEEHADNGDYFISLCEKQVDAILSNQLEPSLGISEIKSSLYKKSDGTIAIKAIRITALKKDRTNEIAKAVKSAAGEEVRVIIEIKE